MEHLAILSKNRKLLTKILSGEKKLNQDGINLNDLLSG